MLTCDHYLTPGSLDEAFGMMAFHHGRHRIVAGATDTLPWAREGRAGDLTGIVDRPRRRVHAWCQIENPAAVEEQPPLDLELSVSVNLAIGLTSKCN